MRLFKKLCCCLCPQQKDIQVNQTTRLLPVKPDTPFTKPQTQFSLHVYGAITQSLHMKKLPQNFLGQGIKRIAAGSQHLLVLTESGYVLAAGNNEFGQCAYDPQSSDQAKLRVIQLSSFQVTEIAAGSYHSLFLTKSLTTGRTQLLGCGHQIGCGFLDRNHKHIPTQIDFPELCEVKSVFAGYMKSGIVSNNNKLFLWGRWNQANKVRKMQEQDIQISEGDFIKKIQFGKLFSVLLTEKGEVFSWGDNTYGEIGYGSETREIKYPVRTPFFRDKTIVDIAAGGRHALFLDQNGCIFGVGDNSQGQCALAVHRSYNPKEINIETVVGENSKILYVWAGESHSAALSSDGDLYAWGDNSANKIGMVNRLNVKTPMIIDEVFGRNVCGVSLGSLFTAVVVGPHSGSLNK